MTELLAAKRQMKTSKRLVKHEHRAHEKIDVEPRAHPSAHPSAFAAAIEPRPLARLNGNFILIFLEYMYSVLI